MSADEAFALLAGGIAAAWSWGGWYSSAVSVTRLGAPAPGKLVIWWWPAVCAGVLLVILKMSSSFDVQDDLFYLSFYMVLGAGWLGALTKFLPVGGLSARDDVLERGNAAAVPALAGALLGFTLCFAGGNVGDGPGWWVVVESASVATLSLAALWLVFDAATGISDAITVERDRAAGFRLGGLLVAAGLILGRGVAGDWVSFQATLSDFVRTAWPAVVLFVVAALIERGASRTPERPHSSLLIGLPPAAAYIAAAAAYVISLGPS
jgi:uncharacterized membrane protein YjfL (UPF0719 family)